ncbi:hypothetical protein A5881_001532 [Enterococcus termitis]|nr:hypothetical protein A5881_002145 [Enterococcus termitis]
MLGKITAALHKHDLTVNDLVKITIYITDVSYVLSARGVLADFKVEIDGISLKIKESKSQWH